MYSLSLGSKGNTLSRKGYFQADLLGQRLKCEKFTHIYCSDISKAKEVGRCNVLWGFTIFRLKLLIQSLGVLHIYL